MKDLKTICSTEYKDLKSNIHKVKHSVIFNDEEKGELEDRIIEDLYRIFTDEAKMK